MQVFELFHAPNTDNEAKGLATRRMHAKLAPQVCTGGGGGGGDGGITVELISPGPCNIL